MPIHRRLPKRGFNNYNRKVFETVNLNQLQRAVDSKNLDAKKEVNIAALIAAGVVDGKSSGVKILSTGELKQKLDIVADKASAAAIKDIEKAGGSFKIAENKKAKEVAADKAKRSKASQDKKDAKNSSSKKSKK